MVYFIRPKDPANKGLPCYALLIITIHLHLLIYLTDHARKELRFKDEATCLSTFKTYIKYRKRCLLTQAIYKEVEVSDLGVDDTKVWKVRSCLPRLRRDQIAKGLSNLPGVSTQVI